MAVHAAGVGALVAAPAEWPSIAGALAANHVALGLAGLVPRSAWVGHAIARLPDAAVKRHEIALTFDDGPDAEETPRVLDLLDAAGVKATFFLVGSRVRRAPALAREIVRRGHAVENHSDAHSAAFACYGLGRLRRDVERAQATIADATGVAPLFFRAPFGFRSPLLDPTLARLGLTCVAWSRRGLDTVRADARDVIERLSPAVSPGAILLLHDGVATRVRRRRAPLAEVIPALAARFAGAGLAGVTLRAACGR